MQPYMPIFLRYIPAVAEAKNLVSKFRGPICFEQTSAKKLDCHKTWSLPAFMYTWVCYSLVRIQIKCLPSVRGLKCHNSAKKGHPAILLLISVSENHVI